MTLTSCLYTRADDDDDDDDDDDEEEDKDDDDNDDDGKDDDNVDDEDDDDDNDDDDADVDLERDGGLVRGEKGIPVKLPLKFLPVLAVHKLEHGLVHHVRLRIKIIMMRIKMILRRKRIVSSLCTSSNTD